MTPTEITPQMDAQEILDIVEKELKYKYRKMGRKNERRKQKGINQKYDDLANLCVGSINWNDYYIFGI